MTVSEQIANLQLQLEQSRAHTVTVTENLDKLRNESSGAVQELRAQLAAMKVLLDEKTKTGEKEMQLLNLKHLEPKTFTGAKDDSYKSWAKKLKTYCNVRKEGFRAALEWCEKEENPVDLDVMQGSWDWAKTGNAKFHDLLMNITSNDALLIVESVPERGFEAWRLLSRRYNPKSGTFELDRMLRLTNRKQCANLNELPAAVDQMEKDIRNYEARSANKFPEEWKMPLLIQLVPKAYKKEIEMKFQLGQRDYAKLAAELTAFSNDARVREQFQERGQADMDVDNLQRENEQWTEDEWWAYFHPEETEDLSYMGKGWQTKGGKNNKGKGGKNGKGGKGTGKWGGKAPQAGAAPAAPTAPAAPAAGGQPTAKYCYWCHKPGHFKRDCKIFLAGQPKLPRPDRPAGSLEQGEPAGAPSNDWEEDQALLEEEDLDSLELQCQECEEELCMMENADDFTFDASHFEYWESEVTDEDDPYYSTQDKLTINTESGESWIAPLTSLVHGETPSRPTASSTEVGKPSRIPLLPHMRMAANAPVKEETLLEKIKREQEEMRVTIRALTAKVSDEQPPPGLEDHSEKVHEPEAEDGDAEVPKRKNRNQSAKKKKVRINVATKDEEDMVVSYAEAGVQNVPKYCDAEVQTTYSLPTTCRDVIWTPACYEAVIDVAEDDVDENGDSSPKAQSVGTTVSTASNGCDADSVSPGSVLEIDSLGIKDEDEGSEPEPPEMTDSEGEEWEPWSSSYCPLAAARKRREDARAKQRQEESDSEEEFPELTEYLERNIEHVVNDVEHDNENEPNTNNPNHVLNDPNHNQDKLDNVVNDFNPQDFGMNLYKTIGALVILLSFMQITMVWWITNHIDLEIDPNEDIDALGSDNNAQVSTKEYLQDKIRRIRYRLRRGITMDSGAANNVMPKRMVRNKNDIRPSKASLAKVHYIAANNGRIPNEGEIDFQFNTTEGHSENMIFQIAEVNKALGSISYMVDHGYSVIFDQDTATGKDISRMIHKASGRTTRFRRERNVWVLDVVVEEQIEHADEPFHRRG